VGVFPEYRPRNARVNTIDRRINDCFERSMNGRGLAKRRPPARRAVLTLSRQ
jgi:thiosulfate dehydrogenase